ncbi:MAG: sigma-54 dependent transcriptional regulator [bacterium]|nr:sigma-54 dependent transcriptional regulator [bacterium]
MNRILIAEDEENIREVILRTLRKKYAVTAVCDGQEAIDLVRREDFDLVITDLKMPGADGMAVLAEVKEENPAAAVIIITAYGTVENAVEAMKQGADDYITKPFLLDELELKVGKLLTGKKLAAEKAYLEDRVKSSFNFGRLAGKSAAISRVYQQVEQVAKSEATVLITGESGTGKELVACAIHGQSGRSGPFIAVHCAAFAPGVLESELFGHEKGAFTGASSSHKGRFELADSGTLFLDEIGEIPLPVQVKLLRVLQTRSFERVGGERSVSVNVRIICATNKDLKKAIKEGAFREDLYWRLNVFPVHLPPLRERGEDILLLAEHFMAKKSRRLFTVSKYSRDLLLSYHWPGNVRELENVIERAVLLSQGNVLRIDLAMGGMENYSKDRSLDQIVAETEKRLIEDALRRAGGVQAQAAKYLGLSRTTLQYKLQKYGLK